MLFVSVLRLLLVSSSAFVFVSRSPTTAVRPRFGSSHASGPQLYPKSLAPSRTASTKRLVFVLFLPCLPTTWFRSPALHLPQINFQLRGLLRNTSRFPPTPPPLLPVSFLPTVLASCPVSGHSKTAVTPPRRIRTPNLLGGEGGRERGRRSERGSSDQLVCTSRASWSFCRV